MMQRKTILVVAALGLPIAPAASFNQSTIADDEIVPCEGRQVAAAGEGRRLGEQQEGG